MAVCVSTHFYNDESDIERLRAALNGKNAVLY
jgi:selenocysteine lyase/cysteine desulfurase